MVVLLVVEDNRVFRTTLREALSVRFPSLEIQEAADVDGALRSLRTCPPDLAVLDINLPDGSGLDLAAMIQQGWPQVPVAICTSHDLQEYREAAGRVGVQSFLVKQDLDWESIGLFINNSSIQHRQATGGDVCH